MRSRIQEPPLDTSRDGLKPSGPSHCVLSVLRTLIEDEGNVVYLGAYKRSGELTEDVDDRVIHPPHRTLRLLELQSHEERLSFSFKALKEVRVRPVDEQGNVTDGEPANMKIWRNYNVILDGNLHIGELQASLTRESFDQLGAAGVLDGDAYKPSRIYKVDLRKVRMISGNWANPGTLGFVSLLREEAELALEQTALNARIKAIGGGTRSEESGIYYGKSKKAEDVVQETYEARHVDCRLMGYKSTRDYAGEANALDGSAALARVIAVRRRLRTVRFLSRSIVFAMEMVGSKSIGWDAGKATSRGKHQKLEQLATYDGAQLKRVTWTEQHVCS